MPPRKSTSRQLQPPAPAVPRSSMATGIPITHSLAASMATPNPAKRLKISAATSHTPSQPPPAHLRPASKAGASTGIGGAAGSGSGAIASSSRVTLDSIPAADMAPSLTPGYTKPEGEVKGLNEEERGRLIHELVGFYPRNLLDSVTEEARRAVLDIANHVEAYVQQLANGGGSAHDREVDIGIYALETLLSNHVDKAFDKFTGWALRNSFDIPDDVEVVMPWCSGLDFDRGAYVASLPKGEETVLDDLESARKKVEQMRYLSQQLERAEKVLDRRLDIARQRKDEVGFVGQALVEANLSPLVPTLTKTKTQLTALHDVLSPMASIPPAPPSSSTLRSGSASGTSAGSGGADATGSSGQKAWEMGRQQYLSWAVGKAIAAAATGGSGAGAGASEVIGKGAGAGAAVTVEGALEGVERDLRGVGRQEDLEAASRAL